MKKVFTLTMTVIMVITGCLLHINSMDFSDMISISELPVDKSGINRLSEDELAEIVKNSNGKVKVQDDLIHTIISSESGDGTFLTDWSKYIPTEEEAVKLFRERLEKLYSDPEKNAEKIAAIESGRYTFGYRVNINGEDVCHKSLDIDHTSSLNN